MNLVAVLTAGLLALFGSSTALHAQSTVTLAWDPSSDPAVAGYKLYQGRASQTYSITNDVGRATSITVSNLTAGVTYYFAVTAYDSNRLESPFSGEISYTVPTIPAVVGTAAQPQVTMNASGQVVLGGAAPAGYTYAVTATSDFQTWTTLGTLIVSTNGTFHFIDPTSTTSSMRFYRLSRLATIPMVSLQLTVNNAHQAVLTGTAPAGYTYAVMASGDFQTWTTLGTLIVSSNGTFQFTDPNAATNSKRFYRLRQLATIPMVSLQLTVNNAHQAVLTGTAPAGYTYAVMSSSDFQNWTTLDTVIVSTNGTFQFTDPNAATGSRRFYRLRQIATVPVTSPLPLSVIFSPATLAISLSGLTGPKQGTVQAVVSGATGPLLYAWTDASTGQVLSTNARQSASGQDSFAALYAFNTTGANLNLTGKTPYPWNTRTFQCTVTDTGTGGRVASGQITVSFSP